MPHQALPSTVTRIGTAPDNLRDRPVIDHAQRSPVRDDHGDPLRPSGT
jgi:hypothetical protein